MHCGFVVKVDKLRKHENADKLQIATFFGNDTIVSLNVKMGDVGVYFPSDLQLSSEYCEKNNLVRKKDENGNEIGGYLDPDKRNIKAIKLRGEKSDGLFMPLSSLDYCFVEFEDNPNVEITEFSVGEQITVVNGHEICKKYIPKKQNRVGGYSSGNHTRKTKISYAPLFAEHSDTEQLAYNLGAFKVGDELEVTLKMHGTSQRTAHLPIFSGYKKRNLLQVLKRLPKEITYSDNYVSGTRRVVMEDFDGKNSFYGSNAFRKPHHDAFVGKLNKGETVYYEVVGFTDTGAPIMGRGNNEKLGKEFVKQYGKETTFSYGCSPTGYVESFGVDATGQYAIREELPVSDVYVYRMTLTNKDGFVVEYSPDFMRYRCEQMGVKTVPVFGKAIISSDRIHMIAPDGYDHDYMIKDGDIGEAIMRMAEDYCDGTDPVGKTHIKEGIVVRVLNRPRFCAYKHKNFSFKVLEGLIKDTADAPDMEEAQEVMEESSEMPSEA